MLHLLIALSRGGIDVIYDFVLTVLLANYMYMYVECRTILLSLCANVPCTIIMYSEVDWVKAETSRLSIMCSFGRLVALSVCLLAEDGTVCLYLCVCIYSSDELKLCIDLWFPLTICVFIRRGAKPYCH